MAAMIDICNMALSSIRGGKINSINESSIQAEQCKLWYETTRDQVLEDAPWGFGTQIAVLDVLDPNIFKLFNWAYAYQYPSDCLRIDRLILNWESVQSGGSEIASRRYCSGMPQPDLNPPVQYKIFDVDGTKVIAANDPELRAEYSVKQTDPGKYHAALVVAIAQLLASNIAIAIAGEEKGAKLKKDALSLYQHYIDNAIARDLNERYQPQPDSEFITVRS